MALEKEDLTTISRYVRDTVLRLPPRDIKAVGIGRVTGTPEADTPPAADSSDRLATTAFVAAQGFATTSYVNSRGPKITTSSFAGGPPSSPSDGDMWIATGVTDGIGNGTRWHFQYDASWSVDAYKWKFVGGPPVALSISTYSAWNVNAWTPFNGIAWASPRKGVFLCSGSWSGYSPGAGSFLGGVLVSLNGGGYTGPTITANTTTPGGYYFDLSLAETAITCPNGAGLDTIDMGYFASSAPTFLYNAVTRIIPQRVA